MLTNTLANTHMLTHTHTHAYSLHTHTHVHTLIALCVGRSKRTAANVNQLHAHYTFPACMYFPVCMYFALLLDTAKHSRCRLDTVNKESQGASEQKTSTKRTLDTTTAVVSDSETRRKTFSGEKHNYQTIPSYRERDATIDLHKTLALATTLT